MPCKKRWCRRSKTSPPPVSRRPSKRKQWTNEQMARALMAVSEGMPANKAAGTYGVPKSTLKDRVSGRVVHGCKPGPRPYLEHKEEKELTDFLISSSQCGYGKKRLEVMNIVKKVALEKKVLRGSRISCGWWRRFLERQKTLSLRQGDGTCSLRLSAINEETLSHYYGLLEDTMMTYNLLDHPERIYNMDETGMPLSPPTPRVVAMKGQRKVRCLTSSKKGQVTVIACGNGVGQAIPPFVIFDAAQLNSLWTKGEVPGTRYGVSSRGWIDKELFHGWLVEHFLKHCVASRPVLLLLDGHSSHFEPQTIRFAKENGIIIICLPPHTTHELQPLDCSLFGPLKLAWSEVCHSFFMQHPGQVVSKMNFNQLFHSAWLKAVTPQNISAGFRKAGIWPFNPAAVVKSKVEAPDVVENTSSGEVRETVTHVMEDDGEYPSTSNMDNLASNNTKMITTFTPKEEETFQRRHEEGYDLYDPLYVAWLELNHPDSESLSLGHSTKAPSNTVSLPRSSTCTDTSPSSRASEASISPNAYQKTLSPLSGHLTPVVKRGPLVKTGKARVLTSSECLAILEEKERRKKAEALEKERRKEEREARKQQKEEEKTRKAQEKAIRTKQRAKAPSTSIKTRNITASSDVTPKTTTAAAIKQSNRAPFLDKRPKRILEDIGVDANTCCVCFGTYEDDGDGEDWLQCGCGKWAHKDCIEDCATDSFGAPRFCPYCIEYYS